MESLRTYSSTYEEKQCASKKRRGTEKGRVDRSRAACESSRRATRRATRPRTLANLSFLPAVTVVLRSDDSALCSGYSGASGSSTALRSTGRIGRQGLACSDVSRASNESLRVATIRQVLTHSSMESMVKRHNVCSRLRSARWSISL